MLSPHAPRPPSTSRPRAAVGVHRAPVPITGHHAGGALVPRVRAVIPQRRRTPRRARHHRRSRRPSQTPTPVTTTTAGCSGQRLVDTPRSHMLPRTPTTMARGLPRRSYLTALSSNHSRSARRSRCTPDRCSAQGDAVPILKNLGLGLHDEPEDGIDGCGGVHLLGHVQFVERQCGGISAQIIERALEPLRQVVQPRLVSRGATLLAAIQPAYEANSGPTARARGVVPGVSCCATPGTRIPTRARAMSSTPPSATPPAVTRHNARCDGSESSQVTAAWRRAASSTARKTSAAGA
jgi:hypothetical protein